MCGRFFALVLALVLLVSANLPAQDHSQPLTNEDVMTMVKAGLTPEVVIAKIKSSRCAFDTAPDVLVTLKKAGVPDSVILAMVKVPRSGASHPTTLLPGELRAVAWRAVPEVNTSYYQQPGHAETYCTGNGNWIVGTLWSNTSCTTTYTQARAIPITSHHVVVYNLVETRNRYVTLGCTRYWSQSKCGHLVIGRLYYFHKKNGKVWVEGHEQIKGKAPYMKCNIVDIKPREDR